MPWTELVTRLLDFAVTMSAATLLWLLIVLTHACLAPPRRRPVRPPEPSARGEDAP